MPARAAEHDHWHNRAASPIPEHPLEGAMSVSHPRTKILLVDHSRNDVARALSGVQSDQPKSEVSRIVLRTLYHGEPRQVAVFAMVGAMYGCDRTDDACE